MQKKNLVLRGNIRNLLRSTPYISALCIRADPFFVFQAEDGIRCDLVTGVQTCALPICHHRAVVIGPGELEGALLVDPGVELDVWEIGRASCRERCRSRWSPYH